MNDEKLNNDIRRFLKKVGIQSQQAIEAAIRESLETGKLKGTEHLDAVMRLHIADLELDLSIRGDIAMQ
jgi:hypothetical protein